MFLRSFYCFTIAVIIFSCTTGRYAATNKIYKKQVKQFAKQLREYPLTDSFITVPEWVGTINFGMRKPNFVIIHHTAQNSCEQTVQTFTLQHTMVSAHYIICKDGSLHHMLNDYLRAWHAGAGKWGSVTDINSSSIGIELDNNGFEIFTEPQINSLLNLLAELKNQFNIPAPNFIGHEDIAPTRKNDPNVNFPWKLLADNGYGLWYDTTGVALPPVFNTLENLRIIGYDIKDSAAAIRAFQRHFLQVDSSQVLSDTDKKVLYSIARRSM